MAGRLHYGISGIGVLMLALGVGYYAISQEGAVSTQFADPTQAQLNVLRRADAALNIPKRVEVVLAHTPRDRSALRSQIVTLHGNVVREYRELNMMRVQLPVAVVDELRSSPLILEFAEEYALY